MVGNNFDSDELIKVFADPNVFYQIIMGFNKQNLEEILIFIHKIGDFFDTEQSTIKQLHNFINGNSSEEEMRERIMIIYESAFPLYSIDTRIRKKKNFHIHKKNHENMLMLLISFIFGFIIGRRFDDIVKLVGPSNNTEDSKSNPANNKKSAVVLILKNTNQSIHPNSVSDIQQNQEYFENNIYSIFISDDYNSSDFDAIKSESNKESKFVFFIITASGNLQLEARFLAKVRLLELTNFLKTKGSLKVTGPYSLSAEQFKSLPDDFHNKNKLY